MTRIYDGSIIDVQGMQFAVRKARREGWGTVQQYKTKGEAAHHAAMEDFRHLRRFCNGDWEYVTLTVTLLDDYGQLIPDCAESLGMVETSDNSYLLETAVELAEQVIATYERMFGDRIEPDDELDELSDEQQRISWTW